MKISDIDANFAREKFNETGVRFYDAKEPPFRISGVCHDGAAFRRMPQAVADAVSEGVATLSRNTSGGRVRFATDSPYVALRCELPAVCDMPHMPRVGVHGFSLYADGVFCGIFAPPDAADVRREGGYTGILRFPGRKMREFVLYMPLYNEVSDVFIGLAEDAALTAGRPYTYEKPLLFYGSSITQGGCASRPGNSYDAVAARMLDSDFINLGFSGNCRGEPRMAEYLAGLECSVFICDYDHNAYTAEHLAGTHGPLFKTFRESQPDTPVVFLTKPDYHKDDPTDVKKRKIVMKTYSDAVSAGDTNVYFIDGMRLFGRKSRDCCTVDGCHPNDLGFSRMADRVFPVLKRILERTACRRADDARR